MLNSRQRAQLRGLANNLDAIFQVGKGGLNEQLYKQVSEALEARELIKMNVLKNCADEPKVLAEIFAERTNSQVVQVIGRKIVLYRPRKENPKIVLPTK